MDLDRGVSGHFGSGSEVSHVVSIHEVQWYPRITGHVETVATQAKERVCIGAGFFDWVYTGFSDDADLRSLASTLFSTGV